MPSPEDIRDALPDDAHATGDHVGTLATTAAFFDIDNTIIRGASAYHLARELYRRGFFGLLDITFFAGHAFAFLLFGENRRRIEALRARALRIVRGRTVAEIVSIGDDVYEQVLAHRIFPGAQDLIADHLSAGDEVWLISATPQEIAQLIARRLGVTGALGTVAESHHGVYTGELQGNMLHGEGKQATVRALAERRTIDLGQSYAYGDSINDAPLLATVGHPCAINPEPRLRLHAAEVGWPVRDFRRRRRDVARGLRGAGWAGAVWAATAVARSLRRRLGGGPRH